MKEKVNKVLSKIRPALGSTNVEFVDFKDGVIKIKVYPTTCHQLVSEEVILEMLEEMLEKEFHDLKKVVAI